MINIFMAWLVFPLEPRNSTHKCPVNVQSTLSLRRKNCDVTTGKKTSDTIFEVIRTNIEKVKHGFCAE
jgi:hypothetical protein